MEQLQVRLMEWRNEEIVVDLASTYIALGRLRKLGADYIELADADMHDMRDTKTSRENYIVKARLHGIQANRATLIIRMSDIVGISRFDDVIAG